MMLTIHGLPISVKYQDLKSMIKEKCNISDYILDNLLTENDGTKKVRVGLADEREGSYLIKCLNGFRMGPNVLSVVPVGKPPPSNPPSNFDQRGYPPRNDYPSQQSGFGNRPIDPIGRTEPLREPNRLDPWGSGNQWSGNQSGPHGQPPPQQNNFGYQQPQGMNTGYGQQATPQSQRPEMRRFDQRDSFPSRQPPQDQGYGFQAKNNLPDSVATRRAEARPHALRSVEVVNEPLPRYSVPEYVAAIKPVTIMKDNFQGPQYNSDRQPNQPGQYHGPQGQPGPGQSHSGPGHPIGGPGQQATWNQQLQQKAPFAKSSPSAYDRKFPEPDKRAIMSKTMAEPMRNIHDQGFNKPGPRFSPRRDVPAAHGRMSSPGRRISSPGRRLLSPGRRLQSPGRRLQSPGRRLLSPGRRLLSPGRRLLSPGRRLQSPGRRLQSPGRRLPSPGHRMPSPGRRMVSPGRRMPSPGRRMQSPGRRMPSPGKRNSPGRRSPGRLPPRRYSPSDKYSQRPAAKDVRPAYDPPSQAFNAGGYRPSLHENVQYPIPGYRQPEQKATPWQTDRDKAMFHGGMKKDDDRREGVRMPKFEGREDPKRSPRKSRSPRRDRSPQRDRFKKHSPSPRSPRRSWALEKRRSPDIRDAPPPPLWPGQNQESFRSRFDEDDKPKRTPVWESRRPEDERRFDEVRGRPQQEPSPRPYKGDDRFPPREPKFEPRDPKFESREPKFEPRDLKFEPRQPRFEPRDPKFEPRQPKFEPRDSKFEPRDPKFEPREPKFEPREPKFEPRDPKFEPRAPKFESRDPKFEPRGPIFEPREEFPKRFSSDFKETPRPNEDIRQGPRHERREDFPRGEFRREEERNIPKIPEAFNKEFEDVYKRALELNKRAEELRRREDRRRDDYEDRREDHDSKNYDKKFDSREAPRDRHDELKRREPEWKTEDRHWGSIPASLKAKKEKALEEIVDKIMDKYGSHFTGEMKARVMEELRLPVGKILVDLFGYQDVSFIEMVVKFQAKINGKEELKLFDDVIASLPTHFRTKKRAANDTARVEVPAKTARRSPDPNMNRDVATTGSIQHVPEWTPNFQPNIVMANQMMMGQFGLMQHVPLMEQQPLMVPAPGFMEMAQQQNQQQDIQQNTFQGAKPHFEPREDEGYNLYLCKDDFEPYNDNQAEYLKKFLVSQLINASGQQWSPDFTIKGLQSLFRYEVIARDEATRDWLLNISFSEFALFNVLVYTKEELWYERAAVWLPGHSRCRNIEPLTKLKLQNRKLDGVNVGKWKLVKKIMTAKGTRIYVDMPPSSARALEKQKMMLSYELQKVSVFLKAVAVDKEAFDSGLRELSVRDPTVILAAAQASPMPSLGHEAGVVKICLKGSKALSVVQARKIKEMLIYHIFKYHQDYEHGALRTDFIKFGFCLPGYFGVVPENPESKRWLLDLDIGKLNRHAVVVMGSDDSSTKYIKMSVMLRREPSLNAALIFERLKQSNQGVKGLNFNLWKPNKVNPSRDRSKSTFCVDMDLESVDTLMKMNFKLDYIDDRGSRLQSVYARCEEDSKVEDLVKKLKAELSDSYDVANMDIASSEEEDDDIIFMGEG